MPTAEKPFHRRYVERNGYHVIFPIKLRLPVPLSGSSPTGVDHHISGNTAYYFRFTRYTSELTGNKTGERGHSLCNHFI